MNKCESISKIICGDFSENTYLAKCPVVKKTAVFRRRSCVLRPWVPRPSGWIPCGPCPALHDCCFRGTCLQAWLQHAPQRHSQYCRQCYMERDNAGCVRVLSVLTPATPRHIFWQTFIWHMHAPRKVQNFPRQQTGVWSMNFNLNMTEFTGNTLQFPWIHSASYDKPN